jgi:hypothetical protein
MYFTRAAIVAEPVVSRVPHSPFTCRRGMSIPAAHFALTPSVHIN